MTLKEYQRAKAYWNNEYNYYSWASCQPASEKRRKEDIEKRDRAWQKKELIKKFEEKALTDALKHSTIDI